MKTRNTNGVTLVELLIVVSIMVILMAIAIPVIRPAMEGRRYREAARSIDVYLGQARYRALETGRPCGVLFERFDTQRDAARVLRQVEVPPPYAGDLGDAVVVLQNWTHNSNTGSFYCPSGANWSPGDYVVKVAIPQSCFSNGLVRRGDRMQLNYQGPVYTIIDDFSDNNPPGEPSPPATPGADFPVNADGFIVFSAGSDTDMPPDGWIDTHVLTLILDSSQPDGLPWPLPPAPPWPASDASAIGNPVFPGLNTLGPNGPNWFPPVSFQIYRQPLPSAAAPLQLTRGVVVDLGDSGTDTTRQWFQPASANDASPVMIMFSPNGAVDRVIIRGSQRSVTEPIFLMVGRWDRTGSSLPEDGLENWQDQSNLWLAVNPQSGLATVAELNADAVTASGVYVPGGATPDERFYNSRKFARQAQISKGGR